VKAIIICIELTHAVAVRLFVCVYVYDLLTLWRFYLNVYKSLDISEGVRG